MSTIFTLGERDPFPSEISSGSWFFRGNDELAFVTETAPGQLWFIYVKGPVGSHVSSAGDYTPSQMKKTLKDGGWSPCKWVNITAVPS